VRIPKYFDENLFSVSLATTDPILNDLVLSRVFRYEGPATNFLSHVHVVVCDLLRRCFIMPSLLSSGR
jgi:hypothetical protein